MDKVLKIEVYIKEFFSTRYKHYRDFYQSEYDNRSVGIYNLKRGSEILDFLNNTICNIEEKLFDKKLVPQIFAKPETLRFYLEVFKEDLNKNQYLLDINKEGETTSYVIHEIQKIKMELVEMIDSLLSIFDTEAVNIPYQELKHYLITKDLNAFFTDMNSILKSVSGPINKIAEGYLHSNIHLILKLLGFDVISEESTSDGRIDLTIRLANLIYIFEFKLGNSKQAMSQIHNKKYYEKFIVERKEIILVGVGFNKKSINIEDFKVEEIPIEVCSSEFKKV